LNRANVSNAIRNTLKITLSLLLSFWLPVAVAQDVYQVLRDDVQGFAEVKRGNPLGFPEDHFPHPDYRIEWWYITANLKDQQGQDWGFQWTLFRQSLSPKPDVAGWDSNQLWMAHAAITTPENHIFEQRFSRGGIGQAGVNKLADSDGFDAWIDDWRWQSSSDTLFPSTLEFSVGEHTASFELNSINKWVLNGDAGFSQKSAQGQASYYYSQPNINLKGTIKTNDKTITLTGNAWLDREWSSQAFAQNQKGWDWFSLHLDDGSKLMVYQLRHDSGDELESDKIIGNNWVSGSWTNVGGDVTHLNKNDIELNSLSESQITTKNNTYVTLPLHWSIKLPTLNRILTIKPLYDEQWLATSFPYWEGVVSIKDDKEQTVGKGYMELTGYQPDH
jgi:predicted secreted hydrolase